MPYLDAWAGHGVGRGDVNNTGAGGTGGNLGAAARLPAIISVSKQTSIFFIFIYPFLFPQGGDEGIVLYQAKAVKRYFAFFKDLKGYTKIPGTLTLYLVKAAGQKKDKHDGHDPL